MRLARLRIHSFKGVELELEWSPLIVLFGPNDAGKTNIIEALAQFSEPWDSPEHVREDPLTPQQSGLAIGQVQLELDGRDFPNHPDRAAVADLLTRGYSWLVPNPYQPGWPPTRHELFLTDEHPVVLDPDGTGEADLAEVLDDLAAATLEIAAGACANWPKIAEPFAILLRACLGSRWLAYNFGAIEWLSPTAREMGPEERAAGTLLANAAGNQPLPLKLNEVAREVASGSSRRVAFLLLAGDQDLVVTPFRIVRVAASATGIADLERSIERQITTMLLRERGLPAHDRSSAPRFGFRDPWFTEEEGRLERLNPRVTELCASLSSQATDGAPPFVTDSYDVLVEALPPSQWWLTDGRRIRVGLRARGGDEGPFHLTLAGNGVALWTGYAVEEALASLGREDDPGSREPRRSLYLVDEPERHLHPTGQLQAADFLARLAHEGSDVVIATHATAFIDIGFESAALIRVYRDRDRITRGEEISGDLLHRLTSDLAGAGFTVADLLQLTRGVLLVEGQHDKRIVEGLCREALARTRIIVMPLRGAHETLALLDADLLRRLGKPLCVMLDNTRAEVVRQIRSGELRLGSDSSPEERQLRNLATLLDRADSELVAQVPFDAPDIICALPEQALRVLHPQFPGWEEMRSSIGEGHFKRVVENKLRTRIDAPWIDRVLTVADEHILHPEPILERAINEAVAFISAEDRRVN